MISANDLTDQQRAAIADWAREGAQLSAIQKRLAEEFDINATYMDTRFLILDLGVQLVEEDVAEQEPQESAPAVPDIAPPAAPDSSLPAPGPLDPAGLPAGGGRVTVVTDQLTRPGTVVSGSVVFSDGVKASWQLDQMGRLGLDADSPGYQPSEPDLVAFEDELRRLLR